MKLFKHIVGLALLALALIGPKMVFAADKWDGGDFRTSKGGKLMSGASVILGVNPGNLVTQALPCTAVYNGTIDVGDVVIFSSLTTSGMVGVTRTTSVAVPAFGIALSKTTAAGQKTIIAREGIALAKISYVGFTAGDVLVTSGTAGGLTKSTAATEAAATQVSQTAVVGTALESLATTGYGRILLHR